MKTKFSGILTLLLAFVVQFSFAQESTITGTVTDESGPLPGVSIIIKGTTRGTETDFDGNYSIKANAGDVLVYSFIGMKKQEKTVGTASVINVVMEADNILDEVVVTAQGIRREKKALGYAVTTIDSGDIESKPETDVAKILTGKIAGVEVNPSGGFLGSGTNVIVRSKNSITGNNQPLYIVDGAPITGDRSFDLDPNNIASTSVLKGLAASTLYGEDGRNGVILITTKTGQSKTTNKKFEITLSNTTSFLEVGNLPTYQNTYGQGADNSINTTFFGNWGARFNGQIVPHHLSISAYANSFPQFQGATVEYKAVPDNVSDFFGSGYGNTTSLILSKSYEDASFSISIGHSTQTGYVKENTLDKLNIGFGGRAKLSNKFSFNASMNFSNVKSKRPTRNLFTLLTWIPRNLDIHNLPFEDPSTGASVYYRTTITNPRWQQKYTSFQENNDRIFIKAGLDYDFSDKVKLSYVYSLDNYNELNLDYTHKGGTNNPLGFLQRFNDYNKVSNHRLSLLGNAIPLTKKISMNGVIGAEFKNDIKDVNGIFSTDQVVFGFLDQTNFREHTPIRADEYGIGSSEQNRIGVYGSVDFAYENYLYLTLSGRNDWASTPEKDNRTLFYPSISLSFIPTSAFEGMSNSNFLKLRASYGTSANFPTPYLTRPTLNAAANAFINPFTGAVTSTNSLSGFLPNPNLKPELLKEFEVGVEGKYFKNRVIFDFSAYKRITEDQILFSGLPNTTGFNRTVINAGRVDTDGIEGSITVIPIQTDDFTWSMTNTFTAYETTVKELPVDRVDISSGINYAIEGEAFGVFRGTYAVRDDEGNLLIDATTGKIVRSQDLGLEDKIIGDPNEDWRLTNINSFSYKGFTLDVQMEYIHGGDIYSVTASNLLRRGVTRDTEDREGTYIIPGVLADPNTGDVLLDANGQKIPNTIQIGANDLYFINTVDVNENIVFDASVIRLRDISLSYNLPEKMIGKTPFGSVTFTLSGNNLWYKAPNLPKYMNLDPEVLSAGVGNAKGLDFQNDPSYKQYSFGVKLTF